MSPKCVLLKLRIKIYVAPQVVWDFFVVVCLVLKGVCVFVFLALEHVKDSNPYKKTKIKNPLSEYIQHPNLHPFLRDILNTISYKLN